MVQGKITAKAGRNIRIYQIPDTGAWLPPSVRDICEAVHLKSTSSVHSHLENS